VSEERIVPDAAEFASVASKTTVFWTNVFQSILVTVVILWVLDIPRRVFGAGIYLEQVLTVSLGLTLALAFIAETGRKRHWSDWIAVAASIVLCGYIAARYEALTLESADLPLDGLIVSAILVFLVLEASRRTSGWGFVGIILAMAVYIYISPHLPGDFQTRYVSPERLMIYLGLDINGAIGSILQVAVIIVIPFTILGQVLARTGGVDFFSDLSMAAMGNFRGGAAKIAVFGSALFGMISGSAVANVLAVGIVTIPMMVKSGFTPYRAAAIESVGSTGGQVMPPVMGASAFIMAEFLQVPYSAVCFAAIIPGILFYSCLFFFVDLEAAKHKIGAAKVDDAPKFLDVLKDGWPFLLPIAFLVTALMYPEVSQLTPEKVAVVTTGLVMLLSTFFGYRGRRTTVLQMLKAISDTGRVSLDIILIGAAAGIMVGIMSISGLAFSMTIQLLALSGDNIFALLLLIAVLAFVLGIGLPTVSVYILTATLLAPALVKLGVTPMAAHMFVMYNGIPLDDHAARRVRSLRCRQYRTHRWLDHGLARLFSRLVDFRLALPVRANAEPADGWDMDRDPVQFQPRDVRDLSRHCGRCRFCAHASRQGVADHLRSAVARRRASARNIQRRNLLQFCWHNGVGRLAAADWLRLRASKRAPSLN
jgi:TRAP transporter 4TM/12TM fusion protein